MRQYSFCFVVLSWKSNLSVISFRCHCPYPMVHVPTNHKGGLVECTNLHYKTKWYI